MQGIRRNVAVFMAFTTIIKCLRRFACCGQVLISNQYVSLFYELNLYEDKVQTTIMLYVFTYTYTCIEERVAVVVVVAFRPLIQLFIYMYIYIYIRRYLQYTNQPTYRVWRTQVVNNSTLTFIIESLMEPNNRKVYSGHNNFEFHAYSPYILYSYDMIRK